MQRISIQIFKISRQQMYQKLFNKNSNQSQARIVIRLMVFVMPQKMNPSINNQKPKYASNQDQVHQIDGKTNAKLIAPRLIVRSIEIYMKNYQRHVAAVKYRNPKHPTIWRKSIKASASHRTQHILLRTLGRGGCLIFCVFHFYISPSIFNCYMVVWVCFY